MDFHWKIIQGENQHKGAALIDRRFDAQARVHFFGQFVGHGEAQARAAPRGKSFGGKERLENPRQIPGWNSTTEVLDGDAGVSFGLGGHQRNSIWQLIQAVRRKDDLFPFSRRFGGIENKIEEDLLDEVLGSDGFWQFLSGFKSDLDFSQKAVSQKFN